MGGRYSVYIRFSTSSTARCLAGWQYLAGQAHGSAKPDPYAAYQVEKNDVAGTWDKYQAAHKAEGSGLTSGLLLGVGAGAVTVGTVW